MAGLATELQAWLASRSSEFIKKDCSSARLRLENDKARDDAPRPPDPEGRARVVVAPSALAALLAGRERAACSSQLIIARTLMYFLQTLHNEAPLASVTPIDVA